MHTPRTALASRPQPHRLTPQQHFWLFVACTVVALLAIALCGVFSA
jgi:hypothetical protein